MNSIPYQQQQKSKKDIQLLQKLQETKKAVEKEIHKRLVFQLSIRAVNKEMSEEDQNLLEQLYLDLRSINPELAFATIKAAASINNSYPNKSSKDNHHAALQQQKIQNLHYNIQKKHEIPKESIKYEQKKTSIENNYVTKPNGATNQNNGAQRAASFHNHYRHF